MAVINTFKMESLYKLNNEKSLPTNLLLASLMPHKDGRLAAGCRGELALDLAEPDVDDADGGLGGSQQEICEHVAAGDGPFHWRWVPV